MCLRSRNVGYVVIGPNQSWTLVYDMAELGHEQENSYVNVKRNKTW